MIAQFANFNSTTGVTTITNNNNGKEKQLSSTLSLGANFSKNFNLWLGGTLRYNNLENKASSISYDGYSGTTYAGFNYILSSRFNISGSGGFNKGSYTLLGAGAFYKYYQVNFGYEIIKNKLSAGVYVNNFLQNDFSVKSYVQNINFQTINTNTRPFRVTYFSLTYRFGRLKEEVSKKKGVKNDDLLEQ